MKSSNETIIGDTLHLKDHVTEPLLGFKAPKPMVFSGVYPIEKSEFEVLKIAIEKLTLNDSSVTVAMETRYLSQYFLNTLSKLNNKGGAHIQF